MTNHLHVAAADMTMFGKPSNWPITANAETITFRCGCDWSKQWYPDGCQATSRLHSTWTSKCKELSNGDARQNLMTTELAKMDLNLIDLLPTKTYR